MSAARFSLGRMVATPGALEALAQTGQDAFEFIRRHRKGIGVACAMKTSKKTNFRLIKTSESSQPIA